MKYFALLVLLLGNIAVASSELEITPVGEDVQTLSKDTYFSYNFGNIRMPSAGHAQWNLRAKENPVEIKGVFWQGDDYEAWTNCPKTLPPREVCTVGAVFRPMFVGQRLGRIFVDLYTERFIIDLIGWGVR